MLFFIILSAFSTLKFILKSLAFTDILYDKYEYISRGLDMKNEIILYRPNELSEHVEVRFEDDTAWLTQVQMAELF